MEMEFWTFWH